MDELLFYWLTHHTARTNFDLCDKIRMVVGVKHKHRMQLEDYWANVKDDYEIKRRMFSRLPLKLIRICEIIQVSDQIEEDVNTIHPNYEKEKDKPV